MRYFLPLQKGLYKYVIPDKFLPLLREQVWETSNGLSVYSNLSLHEYEQYGRYIERPKVVLDIASGLGRTSIYLNKRLRKPRPLFILADRTGRTNNTGDFDPPEDEYYNDLQMTREFCRINGLSFIRTFDTELENWHSLPPIDLVISTIGIGFHVPIERYMPQLYRVLSPDGMMIFGTRMGCYHVDSFKELFRESTFHAGVEKEPFPYEDWLILKGKIDGT